MGAKGRFNKQAHQGQRVVQQRHPSQKVDHRAQ